MNDFWLSTSSALENMPWLLPVFIAIVAFVESFAVVGIVVPGVVILFGLAFVASELELAWYWPIMAAALGAMAGDISSFMIGRHWQDRLWHMRWLVPHQKGLLKAKSFVNHGGAISVVVGRFVGPLRPLLPITAGALGMRLRLFVSLDTLSAWAWAPLYILPGWLAAKSLEFNMAMLSNLPVWQFNSLLIVVVVAAMALWIIMDLYAHEKPYWSGTTRHLTSAVLLTLAGVLIIWQKPWTLDLLFFNNRPMTGLWPDLWIHLNMITEPELISAMMTGWLLILLAQGQRALSLAALLAWVSTIAIVVWLQDWLGIGRPGALHMQMGSFSTPAAGSVAIAAIVVFWLGTTNHSDKRATLKATFITWGLIALLAPTPALLGYNWLSDCILGALIGAAIGHALLFVVKKWRLLDEQQGELDNHTLATQGGGKLIAYFDYQPHLVFALLVIYAHQLAFGLAYKYYFAATWLG